jgi:hypothetical protein
MATKEQGNSKNKGKNAVLGGGQGGGREADFSTALLTKA